MTPHRTPSSPLRRLCLASLALVLTVAGCDEEESDDAAAPASTGEAPEPETSTTGSSTGAAEESTGEPEGGSTSTGAPSCGPTQLCARTIDECEIDLQQAQCEGWYADPAQHMCADIEGYTACNCNCVDEPTCDEYFSCGMLCFEDYC